MADQQRQTDGLAARQIAVAVLGFLLFAPPVLVLFDRKVLAVGLPVLMVYLFLAWGLIIGLVAVMGVGSDRGPE